ncbi:MAG: translation initiation factor IF-2 [Anaerolineaceae bacterium]|nr:translation initiation factor IF-2 [Anaerolineaceae bacterium]MBN2677971.1 translation initiation factor IF-2 [Anaerolineaceae bacterium]
MNETLTNKLELPASVTIRDLAQLTNTSPIQIIKVLMANGVMANINQQIDFDTAAVVCAEVGFEAILATSEEEKVSEVGEVPYWRQMIAGEDPAKLVNRPPVITILGHVDHGKTTLLDAIRHTEVAAGEAGGITQHIGAYQVEHHNRQITFLDTPGHAAFTAMRARGAQGADIVVLVVAANDGVMPQTREAIAHAKAARVPIIVAMNKIDLSEANPDLVKKQLADNGLIPDDWDGDTLVVPVSAKKKMGIDDLLEGILLVADASEIKANPDGEVVGSVIEAEIDKTRGVIATLLVQNGTLGVGDVVVAGESCGKIKAMFDFKGRKVQKAGPSFPVSVLGLTNVPEAGDLFMTAESDREAREKVATLHATRQSEAVSTKVTLEQLFERYKAGEVKELRLIVKADVQGSLAPIIKSLNDLSSGDIKINILYSETGNIGENDIMLASASTAVVVGFNVEADSNARRVAEAEGVSIRLYNIIYRLTEDVEKALKGMLEPEFKEVILGQAVVQAVFSAKRLGSVAGCKVVKGEFRRNGKIRVVRDGQVMHEGEIASLRHEKDDVQEVRTGFECGVGVRNFSDFKAGDMLECYTIEKQ